MMGAGRQWESGGRRRVADARVAPVIGSWEAESGELLDGGISGGGRPSRRPGGGSHQQGEGVVVSGSC